MIGTSIGGIVECSGMSILVWTAIDCSCANTIRKSSRITQLETADIEYAFPFLDADEYGELEGIAHRGDFDLRSHMEGKLDPDYGSA